mgnify:CR=1 FL=1
MSMLNNKPLQGYKFGDFVKFKYNTVVYHQEKGLPMFRDVEQYGYIRTTNIMNGKVTVQPVSSDHHAAGMRVEATKVISKASFNGNIEDYPKSAPQGFQVDQPIYDVPKGTPVYLLERVVLVHLKGLFLTTNHLTKRLRIVLLV